MCRERLKLRNRKRLKKEISFLAKKIRYHVEQCQNLTQNNSDFGDIGSRNCEKNFLSSIIEKERREQKIKEDALKRMDNNKYGTCEECGGKIPERRLAAHPESNVCVNCANKLALV